MAARLLLRYGLFSAVFLASCGGESASTAPPASVPSGSPATSSEPSAATSSEPSAAPPAPAGKRPPCQLGQDQACNEDPAVSALWGRCTEYGTCECKAGFELNPWGRCQPAK